MRMLTQAKAAGARTVRIGRAAAGTGVLAGGIARLSELSGARLRCYVTKRRFLESLQPEGLVSETESADVRL